jgi:3-oxoacyl-[acyl-carrier-protein] synthase II
MRRVVITGLGAVTPVGTGVKPFWHALREGISGIGPITLFDASRFACRVAAEVQDFEPRDHMPPKTAATIGRFARFGVAAARMAYEDAGLSGLPRASRFPVCFGTSSSAVEAEPNMRAYFAEGLRSVSPSILFESAGHAVTGHVSTALGLKGQTLTLASACATGLDVVQWGAQQIRAGVAAGVVAGATEAPLSPYAHAAWCALGPVLTRWPGPPTQALRPFDALHDGIALGEGAGAFVLEELDHARARGARIYAEVLGSGSASEAVDILRPDPEGPGLQEAIRAALRMARLEPSDIDYICAHGNGLPDYDRAETVAYRRVFGRHAYNIPVSSIKPMTGQSLAAAGALQVVAGAFVLEEQRVPPTLNHDIPDAECDLDYVPERSRAARVERLLVVAHAIGGTLSTLVLGRAPED